MPSYKTVFGSGWLKTEDLQGRQIPVTIDTVGPRVIETDEGEKEKLVAKFVGKDKELILNMTNCDMLAQITGTEDYDRWVGARVVLYPTTTRFGNKTVPCLRIRQVQLAPQHAPPAQQYAPPPPPPSQSVYPVDEPAVALDDSDIPF